MNFRSIACYHAYCPPGCGGCGWPTHGYCSVGPNACQCFSGITDPLSNVSVTEIVSRSGFCYVRADFIALLLSSFGLEYKVSLSYSES